jgi:uncharacterized protein involved in exopolysaccharide biosynthesis
MNRDSKVSIEPHPSVVYAPYEGSPEDEVSLVDLWLMLHRHKHFIAAIFGLTVVLGIVVAFLVPRPYTYTTTIQIARGADGALEAPETLLAKLNKSYIPYVVQKNFGTGPEAKRFKIEAKIPQDSRIIIIESKGPDTDQALHVKLHSQILDKLAQDHDPEVDFVKLTMENELNRTRNQLDKLKDEAVLLQSQGKRLDEQELLLREQLKDIEKLIDSSEANRNKAVAEVEGEAKAMTLMLIDNETKKYLDRAGEIKERLLVGLSDDRDKLKNDLAENLRSQTELQEKLQELQAKIVNVRYTRSILPTIRSMESEGPGKPVIMVLAVVFGLIAGIFAAFVAEFRLKVKERLNERPAR